MQFQLVGRLSRGEVQIYSDHSHFKNVRRFFPSFLLDVSTCYDVITRNRHRIALFFVPKRLRTGAYNEDDLAGKSPTQSLDPDGSHDFSAYNAINPTASVPVTSIYCKRLADRSRYCDHVANVAIRLAEKRGAAVVGHFYIAVFSLMSVRCRSSRMHVT